MSKEIYISSTPHETRLAIVEDEALTEIYYERENEYTLAGSIYNGRVTRVLPGMQSAFVDIGLDRDAFLYITDFMEETPDSEEFDTSGPSDRQPRTINGERAEPSQRSDRGERSDRGGRGRRGGRDRDRDRDRSDSEASASPSESSETVTPSQPMEAAQLGEGAPGADGSRRWRGRRGRRRGRGLGRPQADQPTNEAESTYSRPEDDPNFDPDSYRPSYEDAPTAETAEAASEPAESQGERPADRQENRGRREGRRFDSGRRDQRQEVRAPRGFEPSRNLYGVDSEEAAGTGPIPGAYGDAASASDPLILPGESLSKYRKPGDAAPAASAPAAPVQTTPVNLAPPATLYTLAEGWDGGAVLPGETISRRNRTESGQENRRPQRESDRSSRRDARFDQRRQTANLNVAAALPASAPEAPALSAEAAPEPSTSAAAEPAAPAASMTATAESAVSQSAASEPASSPVVEAETEYEPQEASASYRVDPVPPSEYRQSAPVLEPEPEAAAAEPQPSAASGHTSEAAVEPQPHDITSIDATGEMFSESVEVLPETVQHPAPIETPEPASPIRHEGAIVSADAEANLVAPSASGFAPGSGLIDEEIIQEEILEEEEAEPTTLHASSIEEMEDFEEETLEGAADLGTMLREMSIDHITRTSPELEEQEDDLDEEDLDEEEEEDEAETFQLDRSAETEALSEESAGTDFFDQQSNHDDEFGLAGEQSGESARPPYRDSNRDHGREPERRGRRDRRGRHDRERGGDRRGGRSGHSRQSMQSTNLPAISDLLKPGQEILVQIAKEPIAKKGARITSHIALPGRFLVFMPTVNHTGVSRKIESEAERRRLKEILLSEKGDASGGFIVRTAAEGASEDELRSDLRFLLNLWADIKNRSDSSKSPALIYHDLNLVERILRDQVTDNFSAIWVDTESEYERVLRFLQRFQPSLIRRVKLYLKDTPLFEQFGIAEEINKALRSKVWLKSGGSIVINQTEALVAIDINTGKFVGKTARLEDTIVKTNLDAIPEIVRQIRLRDLGGIIIIDFIDMDERKNRNRVMAALEDELQKDRAPSKVLQFNDFGLVAITRKRVKQSLERTLSTTCSVCQGTGMVKSPVTVCNDIYIEMRKMHKHLDRGDIMLRVHPDVVKQLKSSGAKWLQEMEDMAGKTILVKSDPSLHPEQFDIH